MTQPQPCLLRLSKSSTKYKHFPLTEDLVKIGRSGDSTYTILSSWISRCHAILQRQEDNSWTITDNKSTNGIAVNGNKLDPLIPYTLREGDVVHFGVPQSPEKQSEFVYRFFSSLKTKSVSAQKRNNSNGTRTDKAKQQKIETCSVENKQILPSGSSKFTTLEEFVRKEVEKEHMINIYERKLQELAQQLRAKEEENSTIHQLLSQEQQKREAFEEIHKQQKVKATELDAKQKQLEEDRAAVKQQMEAELEARLKEQEEFLRNRMQQQLAALLEEKHNVETKLQQEMEKAILEKDRELQEQLQKQNEQLQKIIESKELEQKALEYQLEQSRLESEKAREDTTKTREIILSELANTMETELQCSICNELFIQATSLNCAHSFCALCIQQWMAVKNECPNCRTPISSSVRSVVLDSYIDHMVEQLSAELKQRRIEIVAERKELLRQAEEAKLPKAGPSGAQARRQRSRRRAGQGRQRNQVTDMSGNTSTTDPGPAADATVAVDAHVDRPIIIVSDAEVDSDESDSFESWLHYGSDDNNSTPSTTDSENSDDVNFIRGRKRAYYGGYGRCFKCGARGHWANGCPL